MYKLLVFALLLIVGCGLPNLDKPTTTKNNSKETTIWQAIVEEVENKDIKTTTQLANVVLGVAKLKHLSKDEVVRFDEKFPDIAKTQRDLTESDLAKLKELLK